MMGGAAPNYLLVGRFAVLRSGGLPPDLLALRVLVEGPFVSSIDSPAEGSPSSSTIISSPSAPAGEAEDDPAVPGGRGSRNRIAVEGAATNVTFFIPCSSRWLTTLPSGNRMLSMSDPERILDGGTIVKGPGGKIEPLAALR